MVSRYLFDTSRRRNEYYAVILYYISRQGINGIHMTELYYHLMRLFIQHALCVHLSSLIGNFH